MGVPNMSAKKEPAEDEEKPEGAEGEAPAEGKKGFSAKKLLLIIVPLILLLGGGAGAYFMGFLDGLLGKKPAAEGEHGEAGAEGAHGEAAADDPKNCGEHHNEPCNTGGPTFLKVADEKGQDLVVNLNSPDGQVRFLQLGVQLELANASDVEKVKAVMPRVIDQFQTYLRELRVKDLRGSAGIYRLQMELLARVNQAAAPVQVKDVLFEKILIQ
jgi:flagellar protein FliL